MNISSDYFYWIDSFLQTKGKEERLERQSIINLTHRHIVDMVALYLDIESSEVIDGVLDDESYVPLIESLTRPGGRYGIMFYYQDGEPPAIGVTFKFLNCKQNYLFQYI